MRVSLVLLTAALLPLAGCGEGEAEPAVSAEPPPIAFEGSVEPKYVGKWSTDNKLSTLDLSADGKASMKSVAPGRGESNSKGEWRLSGENLLFKVDGAPNVLRYRAKLTGDRLKLTQKSTRLDVDYKRQK